jgi:hypothetical protein
MKRDDKRLPDWPPPDGEPIGEERARASIAWLREHAGSCLKEACRMIHARYPDVLTDQSSVRTDARSGDRDRVRQCERWDKIVRWIAACSRAARLNPHQSVVLIRVARFIHGVLPSSALPGRSGNGEE